MSHAAPHPTAALPSLPRTLAAAVALCALGAVVVQYTVVQAGRPDPEGLLARAWSMARYFTILTNLLTGAVFAAIALGRRPSAAVVAGVVLSISMVGIVYHALLAPPDPLPGWEFWTDLGYHTLAPLGAFLWWVAWGDKRISARDLPLWLAWPTLYCVYALARGMLDGRFPYFFLDIGRFGAGTVAAYIAGLVAVFAAFGLLLLIVARLTRRPA